MSQVPTLEKISHKFLVSGHSQMECDSVHATIEGAKKITAVYVPSQWCTVIAMARKGNPYLAIPMKFNHVFGFKDFVKNYCPNLKISTTGHRVNWLKIKWIQIRKDSPRSVFVNYTFNSEEFVEIQVQAPATRKQRKSNKWQQNNSDLSMCYQSKLPISLKKKKYDLINLCNREIITEEYKAYYESLPANTKQKDHVPIESEDDDTDIK
jgi:hypothetical protein